MHFFSSESPSLETFKALVKKGESLLVEELWNSNKAYLASLAAQATGKHLVFLTGAGIEETRIFSDFPFFTNLPVIFFPSWETLPQEEIAPSKDIIGERYQVLATLAKTKEPHIIITSLQACLQKLIPVETFQELHFNLSKGETFPFERLISQLEKMGYLRCAMVSDKGEFAIRGGIIDIFPVTSTDPYRLEFFGDEIESIRIFDPIGQTTVSHKTTLQLTSAVEIELLEKSSTLCTLFDYLGKETLIIFDDLVALEDHYTALLKRIESPKKTFGTIENLLDLTQKFQRLYFSEQPIEQLCEISQTLEDTSFEIFHRRLQAKRWRHPFSTVSNYLLFGEEVREHTLLETLKNSDFEKTAIFFIGETELEVQAWKKKLDDAFMPQLKSAAFEIGYLSQGFAILDSQTLLLPMTELSHRYKIRRQKQRSTYHCQPHETLKISPGEAIVHSTNGIGRFLGIEKHLNHEGIPTEFFEIEYADSAKLFIPLHQAHQINKYIGISDEPPKLHTLGSSKWKAIKEKTQQEIVGFAAELLQLYAERELKGGGACPFDSEEMCAFEENFPFIETEDQLKAIHEIKQDMQSTKPMDRLICGDVGYGKTEVAMRAAFKAVADGKKQVAVLVPTTVLAMQHFENFVERMRLFPINIEQLSRFSSKKNSCRILERLAEGKIDILIGTHRILSEDIQFKDLGLIIIDEEQRFGVKAKEALKKLKAGVDCLTLSATPIPRTLYMSLIGARDLSVINTPPQDRLPITTLIANATDQVLKNALLRELSRGGQAYLIHNFVETIYSYGDRIQKLIPEAKIQIVHGQMEANDIDLAFHKFKSGAANILIATTIIENGIDIPNANTILIDRAERFGLADLYQLRGRVGRWNRRAFAYFLVKNLNTLSELPKKRLQALAESSGYGGGMKIAMRDLEIRGAGNLLGTEQSGQVAAIGFHLYCKLLKRTIQTLKGQIPKNIVDPKLDFPIDARLPENYVNAISLRMELYQKLGDALSFEEVDALAKEMQDRFGPLPPSVLWLLALSRIRVFAALHGICGLKQEKFTLTIERKKGKETVKKAVLFNPSKTPALFEAQILNLLKEA